MYESSMKISLLLQLHFLRKNWRHYFHTALHTLDYNHTNTTDNKIYNNKQEIRQLKDVAYKYRILSHIHSITNLFTYKATFNFVFIMTHQKIKVYYFQQLTSQLIMHSYSINNLSPHYEA
jgi:predicted Zn-dependent protease